MTTYTFTFDGITPSKKDQQQIFKTKAGRPFITSSRRHKAWHTEASWRLRQQLAGMAGKFPVQRAKRVGLQIFYGDRRRRDNSNVWESVADLLVDAGILSDDNWECTGPTYQLPAYRQGRPGWVAIIEVEAS